MVIPLAAMMAIGAAMSLRAAQPVVPGFERFHADGKDGAAGGNLLFGELNCTSCHKAEGAAAGQFIPKQAPLLTDIGRRAKADWLMAFIANPGAVKPGTTMPALLHGLPEKDAKAKAEALTHYLVSLNPGEPAQELPRAGQPVRGEQLFHQVGCAVCHGSKKVGAATLPTSIPLGDLNKKYTLPSLIAFITDPLKVRPSGRMPQLNLSSKEAQEIASYLLNELKPVAGLSFSYYEGTFAKLPDFSKLVAKESGPAEAIDVKLAKRQDNFALRFEGLLKIEKEGTYNFHLNSDDGSRILIDGAIVVDHDSVHAPASKSGKVKLTAGAHAAEVQFFEASGGEELSAEIDGPGLKRQPLADLLRSARDEVKLDSLALKVDPKLVAEGRQLFTSLGCASCHQAQEEGQAVASKLMAPSLSALQKGKGCISAEPAKGVPDYKLSPAQKTALTAALPAAGPTNVATANEATITRTLTTFNCYACHQRGERGGVEADRNLLFETDQKEMGDEARIPPHLNGVGAKLKGEWFKTLFASSPKERPYMFTRMPVFGEGNVSHLTAHFEKADTLPEWKKPVIAEPENKVKSHGRTLVGARGLSCIKCHTFAAFKSTGVQAMSLTSMQKRLKEDWFYHYLMDPPKFRPGTRMPAPWPEGQSFFKKILDGNVDAQVEAVWTYLGDGTKASLPDGLVSASMELIPHDRALIYRNFIDGAGPRAIGVGYPERTHIAWDANNMRLALMWHGAFIDASKHWVGRGTGYQGPLGENIIKLPSGSPFAVLANDAAAWPTTPAKEQGYQFRGYKLATDDRPTFMYSLDKIEIEEFLNPQAGDSVFAGMSRKLTVKGQSPEGGALVFRAAAAADIKELPNGWYSLGESLKTKIESENKPYLRKSGSQMELLVPVQGTKTPAVITQIFDW